MRISPCQEFLPVVSSFLQNKNANGKGLVQLIAGPWGVSMNTNLMFHRSGTGNRGTGNRGQALNIDIQKQKGTGELGISVQDIAKRLQLRCAAVCHSSCGKAEHEPRHSSRRLNFPPRLAGKAYRA